MNDKMTKIISLANPEGPCPFRKNGGAYRARRGLWLIL